MRILRLGVRIGIAVQGSVTLGVFMMVSCDFRSSLENVSSRNRRLFRRNQCQILSDAFQDSSDGEDQSRADSRTVKSESARARVRS